MAAPVLFAAIGVNGKSIVLGGREQGAIDLHESGLKRDLFAGIKGAEHFEAGYILVINCPERRIAVGCEGAIVGRPVRVSGMSQ